MRRVYPQLKSKSRFNLPFFVLCGVSLILALLAVLQFEWIAQVSQAERDRLKENLQLAMNRFARDFEQELFQLRVIGPPIERSSVRPFGRVADAETVARLAGQYAGRMTASRYPTLIRDRFLVRAHPGHVELLRFDPHTLRLDPVDWPPEFSNFRDFCLTQSAGTGIGHEPVFHELPGLEGVPALAFPFSLPMPMNIRAARDRPPRIVGPDEWEIVRLDRKSFQDFIAQLVEQDFPRNGHFDYDIVIMQKESNALLYPASSVHVADFQTSADASLPLNVPGLMFSGGMALTAGPSSIVVGSGPVPSPVSTFERSGNWPESLRGWQLYAKHHSGSLDSFVNQFRARNLTISFSAFLLLALGLIFTFKSSPHPAFGHPLPK